MSDGDEGMLDIDIALTVDALRAAVTALRRGVLEIPESAEGLARMELGALRLGDALEAVFVDLAMNVETKSLVSTRSAQDSYDEAVDDLRLKSDFTRAAFQTAISQGSGDVDFEMLKHLVEECVLAGENLLEAVGRVVAQLVPSEDLARRAVGATDAQISFHTLSNTPVFLVASDLGDSREGTQLRWSVDFPIGEVIANPAIFEALTSLGEVCGAEMWVEAYVASLPLTKMSGFYGKVSRTARSPKAKSVPPVVEG